MKELGKILAYTAAVMLLGCALAPPLYWLGQYVIAIDLVPQLAPFTFDKYFNRAVLVVAVLLLWPFLRWVGIRRFRDLGLSPNPKRVRHFLGGAALAGCGLLVVATLMLVTERAAYRDNWRWDVVSGSFLTAITVAIIEESFFRGALLGLLLRRLRPRVAIVSLSLLFAAVHFFKPPNDHAFGEITWRSGFELFPRLFWQYGDPNLVIGGLVTLLLVGLILAYAVVKTRSLFMALGLHFGWVSTLRSFSSLTRRTAPADLWFGRDLITGLAPVLLLVATFVVLAVLMRRRPRSAETAQATACVSP